MKKIATKQNFNNQNLTRTKVTNNIIRCYNKTLEEQRYDWYMEANNFCKSLSKEFSVPLFKVVGIVSGLSPMKPWNQNKKLAKEFLNGKRSGTFKNNILKCEEILKLSTKNSDDVIRILNGNKTVSFFKNIFNFKDRDTVTIDRHAIEIAVNYAMEDKLKSLSNSQYEFFKNCYIRASNKLNIRPSKVQSATWVYWREHRKSLPVVKK